MHRRTLTAMALTMACLLGSAAKAQDYAIKFHRPVKVGDKYHLHAVGTQESVVETTINNQAMPTQKEDFSVTFDAVGTVVKVNDKGDPTEISFEIEKCSKTAKATQAETEIAPKGATLVASSQGGETTYALKDGALAKDAKTALSLIINLGNDENDDDAIFGTAERKKVGDTWPINSEAAAKSAVERGEKAAAADVKGEAKLVSVQKVNDLECLEVTATFTVTGVFPGMSKLPPGLLVESALVKADAWAMLPTDGTTPVSKERFSKEIQAKFGGETGAQKFLIKVNRSGKRTVSRELVPVK